MSQKINRCTQFNPSLWWTTVLRFEIYSHRMTFIYWCKLWNYTILNIYHNFHQIIQIFLQNSFMFPFYRFVCGCISIKLSMCLFIFHLIFISLRSSNASKKPHRALILRLLKIYIYDISYVSSIWNSLKLKKFIVIVWHSFYSMY